MRRLVLVALLIVAVAAGWWLRDHWRADPTAPERDATADSVWQPVTTAGAERARRAIEGLGRPQGPAVVSLGAGDLASYIYESLRKQLPPSADSIEAAVLEDLMHVRASVALSDLGGPAVLGPLASLSDGRERLQMGGTFEVLRPGLAQFRIRAVRVGNLTLPQRMIPRLLRAVRRGSMPEGVADDALPLVVPAYIAETRIGNAKLILYRDVP
jgi:hypothetical protein